MLLQHDAEWFQQTNQPFIKTSITYFSLPATRQFPWNLDCWEILHFSELFNDANIAYVLQGKTCNTN